MTNCYNIMTSYVKVNINHDLTLRRVVILNSNVTVDNHKKISINVANTVIINNVNELIYDTSKFDCIRIITNNTEIKINKNGDIKL